MRKIEQLMVEALRNRRDWHRDNTSVLMSRDFTSNEPVGIVSLHGNTIAKLWYNLGEMDVYDAGWQTVTTKSRINALLREFSPGISVFQRDHKWFLNHLNSDTYPWTGSHTVLTY